jgi:hypothetical protein
MTCELARKQLPLLVYGELSFDGEEALEQHLESCAGCRGELKTLQALHRLADDAAMDAPAGLLQSCREELRRRVAAEAAARGAGWWRSFWSWRPVALAWRPAGALALLAVGFAAARLTAPLAPAVPRLAGLSGLSEPVASRVRYIEPDQSGRVQIVVEETRQRTLAGSLQEEPIRKLLLAAAADREDAGLRVESFDILNSQPASVEVHRALLRALRGDPNPGVRIKALEGLKIFAAEAETRKALAQALLSDENAGVRTMAVDLLIQRRQQDLVGVLQQLLRQEKNDYIRERSTRTLREMRASVETF